MGARDVSLFVAVVLIGELFFLGRFEFQFLKNFYYSENK